MNGRPTKLNNKTVQKLKEAFKLGCTVEESCCYAEISTSSYYSWLSKNSDFSDEIEVIKKYLEFKSRAVIAQSLEQGDVKTAMWYLERKCKSEFCVSSIIETKQETSYQMSPEAEKLIEELALGD